MRFVATGSIDENVARVLRRGAARIATRRGWRIPAKSSRALGDRDQAVAPRRQSSRISIVNDRHPNLSDPDWEPSDQELIGLSQRAFAGLKEAEAARVATLRSDIAAARKEALARFAARPSR